MAILRPDSTSTLGGVTVKEYLLTKHNPNRIDMPSVSMTGKIIGVTVHNTDWISVASGTTPADSGRVAGAQPQHVGVTCRCTTFSCSAAERQ